MQEVEMEGEKVGSLGRKLRNKNKGEGKEGKGGRAMGKREGKSKGKSKDESDGE